jgi:hypothetical protein
MSKIKLEAPFTAFKGKICKHSNIIYKQVRQTQFTSQICNPRTKPYSEAELARQSKFRTAAAATKTALADPTTRATYEAEFKSQTKYQTLYGFVLAQEYSKL